MKKKKKYLAPIISVVLILAIAAGAAAYFTTRPSDPVNVYNIRDCYLFNYYWDGQAYTDGIVASDKLQTVYLSATQEVTEVNVYQGQEVRAGDPLLTYDTTLSQLSLERQRLDIDRKKLQLSDARTQLAAINKMKPISYFTPAPTPTTKPPATTAPAEIEKPKDPLGKENYQIYGDHAGTVDDPIRVWIKDLKSLDAAVMAGLCGDKIGVFAVLEIREGNKASGEVTECIGVQIVKEKIETATDPTEPSVPTDPTDPTEPSDPTNPTDPTDPSEPDPTNPSDPTDPSTPDPSDPEDPSEPDPSEDPSEPDPSAASLSVLNEGSYLFVRLENKVEYRYYIVSIFSASPLEQEVVPTIPAPTAPSGPSINMNSGYTSSEISQMKQQKQKEIKELEFAIRMAEAEYKIMQKEFDNGVVTSDVDGVVVSVLDPETALLNHEPIVKVSGGGGFTIQGSVSELKLDSVKVGDAVQVDCWMSGVSCEGVITEIGDYPVTSPYGWYGDGNPNVSYYPFTVTVDGGENLQTGEYAQITYFTEENADENFYMQCAFLRSENGVYFAYVAGEDGTLEKRQLQVGQIIYNGEAIRVISGLTMDDYVAFPYGSGVKEGAPTRIETDVSTLYNMDY